EFRLAWLWVEGWRSRLRRAGDEIERARWEERMKTHANVTKRENKVPVIVVKAPGILVRPSRARMEVVGDGGRR
ncbi:hypothetical protein QBC35DRAFT_345190, partial [Podospora australis]